MPPSPSGNPRAEMAAALAAEFSLPIILLRPGEKRPKNTGAFETQASLDPSAIRKALKGNDNYGIAFGPKARCFALDVDEGGAQTIQALTQTLGQLPPTWRIRTQSGGYQDLFDWPTDDGPAVRNRGRFAPGLDVRGEGGQSVGPLSEFLDRSTGELRPWSWAPGRSPWDLPRQPMPQPWLQAIRAYKTPRYLGPPPAKPAQPQPQNRLQAYARSIFDTKLAALAAAPDGLQEATLGAASLKAGSLIARGWLSQAYAHDAIVATMLGLPNYDAHDPWTPDLVTLKTRRGIERGQSSPEPDPAWAAELGARERPSHLKALNGGKPSFPQAEPDAAEPDEPPLNEPVWDYQEENPADVPERRWLYGKHYIRRYVSCTIGAPGAGKSILALTEACAMCSGEPLLGVYPAGRLKVGYWNGEDPADELRRRLAAIRMHFALAPGLLAGALSIGSGRTAEIVLARAARNAVAEVDEVEVERIIRTIRRRGLDVLIVDPFVSSHRVPENDNGAMDLVVKTWGRIAEQTNCAVELVHHPRKALGRELTVDDSRGGSALIGAARSVRVLNQMDEDEASKMGVAGRQRRSYFRVDNGKANLAPASVASWRRIVGIYLENDPGGGLGDNVGVVIRWQQPWAFEGITPTDTLRIQQAIADDERKWRDNAQSPDWVGHLVARVLDLNVDDPAEKASINDMVKTWTEHGLLEVVKTKDGNRRPRGYVRVGDLIDPATYVYD
jgi:AAA domain/Bifunctional DNA primase/polymerase, N-terminal